MNKQKIHRGYLDADECSYKGLSLKNMDTEEVIKFNTGNFIIDYTLFTLYICNSNQCTLYTTSCSSGIDHLIFDMGYKQVYVEWVLDNPKIIPNEVAILDSSNLTIYVFKKDMNTWEEYILYWKAWKDKNPGYFEDWKIKYDII